jgi:hypothetical protein
MLLAGGAAKASGVTRISPPPLLEVSRCMDGLRKFLFITQIAKRL